MTSLQRKSCSHYVTSCRAHSMAPIIRGALGASCDIVLSTVMQARHHLFTREYHLCAPRGSVLMQCTRLSALPYHVPYQNRRVFLEDAWKTPGRHGHLSQNRSEDTDPLKTYRIINVIFLNACLPKVFTRGVHVFQASSRRLPEKYECFQPQWLMSFHCPVDISKSHHDPDGSVGIVV